MYNSGATNGTLRREWFTEHKSRAKKRLRMLSDSLQKVGQNAVAVYKDITITNMVWVFFIGCFAGYLVETAYCIITTGIIESRQGMIYGPFCQIYGFGAIVMALVLTPLISKRIGWLFCGSAVAGGLFEVICSLLQETLFGSVSWQYSDQTFALFNGRTSLTYMFYWGILGTVYIRCIHPKIIVFLSRLTKRPKRFFTSVIAIGLSLNMLLSSAAVIRWTHRTQGAEPKNRIEELIDLHFPNNVMEKVYPNMDFLVK